MAAVQVSPVDRFSVIIHVYSFFVFSFCHLFYGGAVGFATYLSVYPGLVGLGMAPLYLVGGLNKTESTVFNL